MRAQGRPRRRPRMRLSVYALLVIRSLLVFNGFMVTIVGILLALFMQRPAGFIFAIGCWIGAGAMFGMTRYADRLYESRP
jgi:hypothetical protein